MSSYFLRWWYHFVFSTAVKQSSSFSKFSPTLGKFLKKFSSVIIGFAIYFIMVLIWIACGIFQDQGLNPCLLHWQLDFLPLQKVLKSDSLNLSVLFLVFKVVLAALDPLLFYFHINITLSFYLFPQKKPAHILIRIVLSISSVVQSCLTLWPHGLQHTRLLCLSPTPRACSNSYP